MLGLSNVLSRAPQLGRNKGNIWHVFRSSEHKSWHSLTGWWSDRYHTLSFIKLTPSILIFLPCYCRKRVRRTGDLGWVPLHELFWHVSLYCDALLLLFYHLSTTSNGLPVFTLRAVSEFTSFSSKKSLYLGGIWIMKLEISEWDFYKFLNSH